MNAPLRREQLYGYQGALVDRIYGDFHEGAPGTLLAVEMGLGKTVSSMTAFRDLLDEFVVRRLLIVAPLLVAQVTWPDEFERWEHLKPISYRVLCGTAKQREKALAAYLENDEEVAVINRENLPWLWKAVGGLKGWPFDALLYDEASRLKSGKKRTAKGAISEFGVVAAARAKLKYTTLLSGTIAPNGPIDLWGPLYVVDHGKRLGTTRTAFLNRWFIQDRWGYNWHPKDGAKNEIVGRIKDVTVSLKADDVLDLPDVVPVVHRVELSAKQMKDYRRFERTLALEEHDVEAVTRGVLANKLVQYANGGLYRTDEDVFPPVRETIRIHDEKMRALESIVEETGGENLLVAYGYQFDLERLRKKFPEAVVVDEDPDALRRWNRGEVPMILAHPASLGHGLNLQFGGRHTVWYGLTPSLELYQQFNARLRRKGQESERVFIHHIVTAGTFDERLMELLAGRAQTQEEITAAVRMHLRTLA